MHPAHQQVFTWMTTCQPLIGGQLGLTPFDSLVQSRPFAGRRSANLVLVGNDQALNTAKFCTWVRQLLLLGVHVVVIEGRGECDDRDYYHQVAQWARDRAYPAVMHPRSDDVAIWDASVPLTIYNGNPWFFHFDESRAYADFFCRVLDHLSTQRATVADVWDQPPVVVIFDNVGTHAYALPATLAQASARWPQMNMHLWFELPDPRFALTEPGNALLAVWSQAAMIGIGAYHNAALLNTLYVLQDDSCRLMQPDQLLLSVQGRWQSGTLADMHACDEHLLALSRAGDLLAHLSCDNPHGPLLVQWIISQRLKDGGNVTEWINQLDYVVQCMRRTTPFPQRTRLTGTRLETIIRRELFPYATHQSVVQWLWGPQVRFAPHVDVFMAQQ